MSDSSRWLQNELSRRLGPAKAPPSLWNGIQAARQPASGGWRSSFGWALWPAIAFLLFLASADLVWEMSRARGAIRQVARTEGVTVAEARDLLIVRNIAAREISGACLACHVDRRL